MEFAIKNPKIYSQDALEEDTMLNANLMSAHREIERPKWTSNGTLCRRASRRHYIPRHPFYYSAEELFANKPIEQARMKEEEVKDYISTIRRDSDRKVRAAFSAPQQRRVDNEKLKQQRRYSAKEKEEALQKRLQKKKEEPTTGPQFYCPPRIVAKQNEPLPSESLPGTPLPQSESGTLCRPRESPTTLKSGTYQKTFPNSVPWHLSGVPGIRVLQEHDHYRRRALDLKNTDVFHINSGIIPKYLGYVPGLKFRHGGTYGRMTYNAKEVGIDISSTWGGAVSLLLR